MQIYKIFLTYRLSGWAYWIIYSRNKSIGEITHTLGTARISISYSSRIKKRAFSNDLKLGAAAQFRGLYSMPTYSAIPGVLMQSPSAESLVRLVSTVIFIDYTELRRCPISFYWTYRFSLDMSAENINFVNDTEHMIIK